MLIPTLFVAALQLGSCLGLPQLRRDEESDLVDASIADFVASLGVSDATAEEITSTLAASEDVTVLLSNSSEVSKRNLSSQLAPVACAVAKLALGSAVVQASSQSLVEVNWCVTLI